jgi:hypothetical protein
MFIRAMVRIFSFGERWNMLHCTPKHSLFVLKKKNLHTVAYSVDNYLQNWFPMKPVVFCA